MQQFSPPTRHQDTKRSPSRRERGLALLGLVLLLSVSIFLVRITAFRSWPLLPFLPSLWTYHEFVTVIVIVSGAVAPVVWVAGVIPGTILWWLRSHVNGRFAPARASRTTQAFAATPTPPQVQSTTRNTTEEKPMPEPSSPKKTRTHRRAFPVCELFIPRSLSVVRESGENGDPLPLLVEPSFVTALDQGEETASTSHPESGPPDSSPSTTLQEDIAGRSVSQQDQEQSEVKTTEQVLVHITLLENVTMTLHVSGMSQPVPLTFYARRLQLLAYIAWLRGERANRDKMLEQIFGHGRSDEEATSEKLGMAFESSRKSLRLDIRAAGKELNATAGRELIPPNFDVFSHKRKQWGLAVGCRVVDLEQIEAHSQMIEAAKKAGLLTDTIPEQVKAACDTVISTYRGDFLGQLIQNAPDDFDPWVSSWARRPYTLYRDYYLQALWYAAEYEYRHGEDAGGKQHNDVEDQAQHKQQREHYDRAAQLYHTYAMYACNSRFDTKVTFGTSDRGHGERVVMSERALRRSIALYGLIGRTDLVDQVYTAYEKQMLRISAKNWSPSADTLKDLQGAKAQTNAHRFPAKITHPDLSVHEVKQEP